MLLSTREDLEAVVTADNNWTGDERSPHSDYFSIMDEVWTRQPRQRFSGGATAIGSGWSGFLLSAGRGDSAEPHGFACG